MKLAFTGAQSTGKTTLLKELKRDPDFSLKFDFRDEITRRMQKKGLSINESGNDITQLLIMNSHIKNTLIDNVIMDRCALDGLVYTDWMYRKGKIQQWVIEYADNVFKMLIDRYDYIFYLVPEFDIEDDGVRSTDIDFRNEIVILFEQYIKAWNIPVIKLTGTVEQRLNKIKETINE
jgi:nicotinamide riboside kinase|tara:strand:- start:698 stop:1228 length:531 start_codon:yes stop_codon:yes gene_type:complete